MENNQTDFMKNRPGADKANQYKDVYGTQKTSTRATISVVLAVVDFILMMIGIFTGNNLMMIVFIPLFIILLISFIVAKRADKYNAPVDPSDSPEALFRDHEE